MFLFLTWLLFPFYSGALLALVWSVRNLRPESSRMALQRFIAGTAVAHWVTAALCFSLALLIAVWPHTEISDNQSAPIQVACFLGLSVILVLVGFVFWFVTPAISQRASASDQMEWDGYLSAVQIAAWVLMGFWAGLWIPVLIAFQLQLKRLAIRNCQSTLLWTLTIACRKGLPLAPEVHRLSQFFWGRTRQRLIMLSENLDAGHPLSVCLERQVGLLPRYVQVMAQVGEEAGSLSVALDLTLQQYRGEVETVGLEPQWGTRLSYLFAPLSVLFLISSFVGLYIIPKFKKIMEDFGMELPSETVGVVLVMDLGAKYFFPLFFSFFLGGGVLLLITLRHKDWETDWPLLDEWFPRRNAPSVLRPLALMVQMGHPLRSGLWSLLELHPRLSVRRRLRIVVDRVEQGHDLWQGLQDTGFIVSPERTLLHSGEKTRHLSWTLLFLAQQLERASNYRQRMVSQFASAGLLFLISIPIALFAIALFMPLVALLRAFS